MYIFYHKIIFLQPFSIFSIFCTKNKHFILFYKTKFSTPVFWGKLFYALSIIIHTYSFFDFFLIIWNFKKKVILPENIDVFIRLSHSRIIT